MVVRAQWWRERRGRAIPSIYLSHKWARWSQKDQRLPSHPQGWVCHQVWCRGEWTRCLSVYVCMHECTCMHGCTCMHECTCMHVSWLIVWTKFLLHVTPGCKKPSNCSFNLLRHCDKERLSPHIFVTYCTVSFPICSWVAYCMYVLDLIM